MDFGCGRGIGKYTVEASGKVVFRPFGVKSGEGWDIAMRPTGSLGLVMVRRPTSGGFEMFSLRCCFGV